MKENSVKVKNSNAAGEKKEEWKRKDNEWELGRIFSLGEGLGDDKYTADLNFTYLGSTAAKEHQEYF